MLAFTLSGNHRTERAEIPDAHGPALRSALQEIRDELGQRLSGIHQYDKEAALTRAVSALATLASIVNAIIPKEDQHYA